MRIALAQIQSVKGDIAKNISRHTGFINNAVKHGVDFILFPELSITGYEPSLASELAVTMNDDRFDVFRELSGKENVIIGIGAPIKKQNGTAIALILFEPSGDRWVYEKKYLHADELPWFIPGENLPVLNFHKTKIALAICYELSVEMHAQIAHEAGASVYLSSVAKSAGGMKKASERLSQICRQYQMISLLVNSVGPNDDFVSSGNSGVWNREGQSVAELGDGEGLLVFDTETGEAVVVNSCVLRVSGCGL